MSRKATWVIFGVDEMVVWLAALHVESSTELLAPLYSRSGIGADIRISWEQLLYILSGHAVSKNAVLIEKGMAAGAPPVLIEIDAETERRKEEKDLALRANISYISRTWILGD